MIILYLACEATTSEPEKVDGSKNAVIMLYLTCVSTKIKPQKVTSLVGTFCQTIAKLMEKLKLSSDNDCNN